MKNVIITKGLPGSGKSTWAKQVLAEHPGAYKRVNKDDLRAMLDNGHWSKGNEKFVIQMRDMAILAGLEAGCHVIVDDTNLAPHHVPHIEQLVKGKAKVVIQDFTDVDLDTCIERDLKRLNPVGSTVIRKMYKQFLAPKPPSRTELYVPGARDAIICDLDGTLALLNGRNPYDASTCEQDELNFPVYHILTKYARYGGAAIILMSGRSSEHRPQTERWLDKHEIRRDHLYMRGEGDTRKDAIIKRELYSAHVEGQYNVLFVLDDRNQVVDLWRSLGLTCLQVAEGDF